MTSKEAIKILRKTWSDYHHYLPEQDARAFDMAIEALEQFERKKGKWIGTEADGYADGYPVYDVWECSECGYEHKGEDDTLTLYCPMCGAKMEEE